MADQDNAQVIAQRFTPSDLSAIRRLRNYYRSNFQNGDSDESFLLWVEDGCTAIGAKRSVPAEEKASANV